MFINHYSTTGMNLDENINKIDKPFYKEIVKKIYPLGFKHEAKIILKDAIPLVIAKKNIMIILKK